MCHPQSKQLFETASNMLSLEEKVTDKGYLHHFLQYKVHETDNMLSEAETARLWKDWCKEQGLSPTQTMIEMYKVLGCMSPKKNTLYWQGQSNAGKTYWLDAITPEKSLIGEMITSAEFAFQECVNKPVILINELTITTPEQAELHKQVWEGQPVMVNIKCKPAVMMSRKPVICTSNNLAWLHMSAEREAFKNRCYSHLGLQMSRVLKQAVGRAYPKFFQAGFKLLDVIFEDIKLTDDTDDMTLEEEQIDQEMHEFIDLETSLDQEMTDDDYKELNEMIPDSQPQTEEELKAL